MRAALSKDTFDKFLGWLDSDPNRAGDRYELLRRKLVKFFEFRQCLVSEELADETLTRAAVKVAEGLQEQPQDPYQYIVGVARFVELEHRRSRERDFVDLDSLAPADLAAVRAATLDDERLEQERRLTCLDRCLAEHPLEYQKLILRYYEGDRGAKIDNRVKLAEEHGLAMNALRLRMQRMRDKLEKCLLRCLEKK